MSTVNVHEIEDELYQLKQDFVQFRNEHQAKIRQKSYELNMARLMNRPTYPTQEILDGMKILKDLKPPQRGTRKNTGLCRNMSYDKNDSMVTITCDSPHNILTGEKLWSFTKDDIRAIHRAFEDNGFTISNVVPMRNNNVVVFTVKETTERESNDQG